MVINTEFNFRTSALVHVNSSDALKHTHTHILLSHSYSVVHSPYTLLSKMLKCSTQMSQSIGQSQDSSSMHSGHGNLLNYQTERRKYLIGYSWVEEKALLLSEVRGQTGQTSLRTWKKNNAYNQRMLSHPPLQQCIYMHVQTHTYQPLSPVPSTVLKKQSQTPYMYTIMGLCNYIGWFFKVSMAAVCELPVYLLFIYCFTVWHFFNLAVLATMTLKVCLTFSVLLLRCDCWKLHNWILKQSKADVVFLIWFIIASFWLKIESRMRMKLLC